MQIVGRDCFLCREKLVFANEGSGCARCGHVFHRKCVGDANVCPACEDDLTTQEAVLSEERAAKVETGRLTFLTAAGALLTVLWLIPLSRALLGHQLQILEIGFISKVVWTALLAAAYVGFMWARYFLAFLSMAGVSFVLFVMIPDLYAGKVSFDVRFGCIAILVGYMFFAFTLSEQVTRYIRYRQTVLNR